MPKDVTEFIGIYDADSTVIGEVSYWIGARLGRRHCSLCDITHGMFTERRDWKECRVELVVPFVTYHRNDAPSDALVAANGDFPCVLARQSGEVVKVFGEDDLERLDASPNALVEALNWYVTTGTTRPS